MSFTSLFRQFIAFVIVLCLSVTASVAPARAMGEQNLSGAEAIDYLIKNKQCIYCDFSGADLHGLSLAEARLYFSKLIGTNLSGADLTGARVDEADFSGANLSNANFTNGTMYDANLSNANLYGTNLYGVYGDGANLSGANLQSATIKQAHFDDANFTNADFGWTCTHLNTYYTSANFTGAKRLDVPCLKRFANFENTILPDGSVYSDPF